MLDMLVFFDTKTANEPKKKGKQEVPMFNLLIERIVYVKLMEE